MPKGIYTHKGTPKSTETRRKMSEAKIGKPCTQATRAKISKSSVGKKLSEIHKKRIGLSKIGLLAKEKCHLWKGGITPINAQIRNSIEMKLWRKAVFERDGYACIWGGKEHGNKLNADHIKPFALFPELRFAIDNGRTLCVDCHRKTETYGGRSIKQLD